MFERKFNGPLQAKGMRGPIREPEKFNQLAQSCMHLLATVVQAPGKSLTDLLAAAKERRTVDGVEVRIENFERALAIADQLIEMEPLRGVPWTLRTQSLIGLGRLGDALQACERSIDIDPSDPDKWAVKSRILNMMGNRMGAASAEKRSQELR